MHNRDTAAFKLSTGERRVLDLVRRKCEATRAEITLACELTAPSISRIVDSLEEQGLLYQGEKVIKGRGQPSARLRVRPNGAFGVGLSIMTDAVSGAVMDLSGAIIAEQRVRLGGASLETILADAHGLYDALLNQAGLRPEHVCGVGVAVTGYFVGRGRQVNPPDPLGELAFVDLDTLFAERLRRPVWIDNDGNAGAMGEALIGAGLRFSSFAYLYFAMGIGGAVVIDGKVYPGAFGNAGEFAGVLQPHEHESRPTLELLRVMASKKGRTFEDIYEMTAAFDVGLPGVEDWIDVCAPKMDAISSAIHSVIDPEAIVLGGRLPRALGQKLAARIQIYSVPRRGAARPMPQILASAVNGDSTAIGAAAMPLKTMFFS